MAELPVVTGDEAVRAFVRLGFSKARKSGGHQILIKPGHRYTLSVPIHGRETVKRGTLRALIRASGATVEQFVAAL